MLRRPQVLIIFALLLFVLPAPAQSASSSTSPENACAKLQHLSLRQAHVLSAEVVEPGAFVAPARPNGKAEQLPLYGHLPAFCRVVLHATPSPDSQIRVEVWLPVSGWNKRLQGIGNGGFAGEIDYRQMALSVANGFASTGTDTGHIGDGIEARLALGHPQKVVDFGWRGIHQMTVQAKAVVAAYYGFPAQHNYFASCSDGGREALMEAQRFPADYDGIVAGAPAYAWTDLLTSGAIAMKAMLSEPANYLPASKVPLISHAVLEACDRTDGLRDGLVSDPRACHFEPATLSCKAEGGQRCLTEPQVTTLVTLYASHTVGGEVLPGLLPTGAEEDPNGWPNWVMGPAPGKSAGVGFASGFFGNMVYSDPHWDFRSFDPEAGLKEAREKTSAALDATSTDLKAFHDRGGKLILYHGWADAGISPLYTIRYYEGVEEKLGRDEAASFTRLYMLPGVKHCFDGPGPDSIGQFGLLGPKSTAQNNAFRAVEDWVEEGKAPDAIIASKYAKPFDPSRTIMTRPACPYPQQAHYTGKGSIREAASFVCK
jgi:hypothetical protein